MVAFTGRGKLPVYKGNFWDRFKCLAAEEARLDALRREREQRRRIQKLKALGRLTEGEMRC